MIHKNQFKAMFFCLFLSANAGAQETSPFKHDFTLGIEAMRYFYKEPDIYQDELARERGAVWTDSTGYLFGINGSYCLTWKEMFFMQPEGRILYGKDDYRTGIKEKVNSKTKKEEPVWLYETRLIAGGKIPVMRKLTLSPYTGIGYRFKSDDSEELKTNQGTILGYYRKSNYVYVPFGVYVDYAINNVWSVALKGEYDWMVKGWQYTRSLTSSPRTYKQPNGYGLKGEVSVSYLYQKVRFSITPYINYWNIRNSKRFQNRGREPYNITFESGMRLGVTF
jgi:hypothetical protein